jgi:hypothetical protein
MPQSYRCKFQVCKFFIDFFLNHLNLNRKPALKETEKRKEWMPAQRNREQTFSKNHNPFQEALVQT